MKDFQAIVELIGMQPQKTYVASPPELEMILARTSVGGQPK
jgi:CCR4-NOT transcriptional complex subunit CAF120